MGRFIGIRHRVKQTAQGEARPTQIHIVDRDTITVLGLDDETAELDFALGRYPTAWRDVPPDEDLSAFPPHHVQVKKTGTKVPSAYDGLKPGDTVAMVLGGSGDNLAFGLSRRGEAIGARVVRIPPFVIKDLRGSADKDEDAKLLAELAETRAGLFTTIRPRDRSLILVRESFRARQDAMQARIACGQRLRQHVIGSIFCGPGGLFEAGSVEAEFDKRKASDVILQALIAEEKNRDRELAKNLDSLDIYVKLFEPVTGCGPAIAARLISTIIDIRRFETDAKLKKYCGVAVTPEGAFQRRRKGQVANWSNEARTALWLLADQFNRRPDSEWGQKLLEYKAKMRIKHPDVIEEEVCDKTGKKRKVKRYTPGHTLAMAKWRTVTKFVEWLWREWWTIENPARRQSAPKRTRPNETASMAAPTTHGETLGEQLMYQAKFGQ